MGMKAISVLVIGFISVVFVMLIVSYGDLSMTYTECSGATFKPDPIGNIYHSLRYQFRKVTGLWCQDDIYFPESGEWGKRC
mgnify:FL=1